MIYQKPNSSDFITRESLEETINALQKQYKEMQEKVRLTSTSHWINIYGYKINALYDLKKRLERKYRK